MSDSDDRRTEYERYNNAKRDTGNNPQLVNPEHNKVSDRASSSSPEQTAAYLADMLQELQTMAAKAGHSSLGEMLEFAHREAIWRSRAGEKIGEQNDAH